jgi:ketosteroid isomerase-like protein
MKNIIILLLSLIIGQTALAQNTKTDIESLERKRFVAQVSKDFDFLQKIFADDLVYTHSNAKVDNKVSYIASIKEGKSVYKSIDLQEISVREYGKIAVVNGRALIELGPVDGKPNNVNLRYTVVYSKNGKKGWQVNTWQSTKLL